MAKLYTSLPLRSELQELRLLSISPASTSQQLQCNLVTFSLLSTSQEYNGFKSQDALTSRSAAFRAWSGGETFPTAEKHRFEWGDYAALSYVWGDQDDNVGITVNDTEIQITRNLANALHCLRKMSQFGDRFRLWVDALCIDQDNLEERREQVAIMRSFYSTAWTVVAFLGPEADQSDEAFNLVESLARIYGDDQACRMLRDDMMQNHHHHTPGSWLALNRLLLRPYWERLWVMQELALGGLRVLLCCGEKRIGWETFCHGIGVIHLHLWVARHDGVESDQAAEHNADDTRDDDATEPLNHIWKDLWMLSRVQQSDKGSVSFGRLLEMTNACTCSEERDKVYGILGVLDPELSHAIKPDYAADVDVVFCRVAKAYISTYRSLELLRYANIWGGAGAPSWVPDWTWSGRDRDNRPDDSYRPETNEYSVLEQRPYIADGGLQFSMPDFDGNHLGCEAVIFDYVDGLGCHLPDEDNPELIQSQSIHSAYGDANNTSLALGTTLYASRRQFPGHSAVLLNMPLTMDEAIQQFSLRGWRRFIQDLAHYHRWCLWFECNADLMVGGRELRTYFSGSIPDSAVESEYWASYTAWVRTVLAGSRRLVTTRAGRFGWVACCRDPGDGVPNEVRSGDAFCIFPGSSMPILLRPTSNRGSFRVIGETYVHGVMGGKVRSLLEQGQCQLQKIWLS